MNSSGSPHNGALIDRFGRVHDYLRISLVDKCNLRCTYCMPENVRFLPKSQLFSDAELIDVARIFVEDLGIKKIRLTGGEPLVRQNADAIIRTIGQLPVKLSITTNGLLLDRFFDVFEDVGMRSITVSLDSLDPQRFAEITRRDVFPQVYGNIRKALDRGFRVKLNMVVVRGMNDDELADFVELTKTEDMHVRFIEFMPFDGNRWDWNSVYTYREMLERLQAQFAIHKLNDKPNSTSKAWQVEGYKGTFAVISTVTEAFCAGCNRIRLTADGKIRNCLFARDETDVLTAYRAGEDIRTLIRASILAKHEKLGGLPEFQDEEAIRGSLSDRAMVKIGG